MKYQSQKIALAYFLVAMALFAVQVTMGLVLGWIYVDGNFLSEVLPFNVARMLHTNSLIVWLLLGFFGAAYYLIPEETEREIHSSKLAYLQLAIFVLGTAGVVVTYFFNLFEGNFLLGREGREFLEQPRWVKAGIVVAALIFLYNVSMTVLAGKKTAITNILLLGLWGLALLFLFAFVNPSNLALDKMYWWYVVHLWVEGTWELVMASILAFLMLKLTGVDREVVEKWLYVIAALALFSGILGTGHHYYYIGTPSYWLCIGGIFSALEPLAFLGMAAYAIVMMRKGGREHPNKSALAWTIGCAIMAFVGAGFLGIAHTIPQVNIWTHGTLVTAMHGHMAFWGAYAMLVLAIMSYALPHLTGRSLHQSRLAVVAFWCANIGMIAMTLAFAVAGVAQVYLERKMGLDFMDVQREIAVHFVGLVLAAALFTLGIVAFIVHFVAHGRPVGEVQSPAEAELSAPPTAPTPETQENAPPADAGPAGAAPASA